MLRKKTVNILILVSMLVVLTFNLADAGIKESVEQYASSGGAVIEEEIDNLSTSLVYLARGIFGTLAVVFIMWAGFVFWGAGGDPNKMIFAKKMLAGFVICMVFVFMAEKIVGGALGLIGYDSPVIEVQE